MSTRLYTAEERAGLITKMAELLATDSRIDGVVLVGSLVDGGDQWSDIDLQAAVADDAHLDEVADGWRERSYADLSVLHHIAFPLGDGRMLCLLLDNMLEIDLAFTPTGKLGVYEPFRLLYARSDAVETALRSPPTWESTPPEWTRAAGGLWHDVLHACMAVRRDRSWQALFYLERIRTAVLRLASQQRGYYAGELNYVDDLPSDLLKTLHPTLVSSLESAALFAAIDAATRGFLVELRRAESPLADRLERPLLEYVANMAQDNPGPAGDRAG